VIIDFFNSAGLSDNFSGPSLGDLSDFRSRVASKAAVLHEKLRREYLFGSRGPTPAISKLGKTRCMYSYIRTDLGVKMHGTQNFSPIPKGIILDDEVSVGENISKIYEAIRDGRMQEVVFSMFA